MRLMEVKVEDVVGGRVEKILDNHLGPSFADLGCGPFCRYWCVPNIRSRLIFMQTQAEKGSGYSLELRHEAAGHYSIINMVVES